jgi:hypothetical protein
MVGHFSLRLTEPVLMVGHFSLRLTAPAGTSSVSTALTSAMGTWSRPASSVRCMTSGGFVSHSVYVYLT